MGDFLTCFVLKAILVCQPATNQVFDLRDVENGRSQICLQVEEEDDGSEYRLNPDLEKQRNEFQTENRVVIEILPNVYVGKVAGEDGSDFGLSVNRRF